MDTRRVRHARPRSRQRAGGSYDGRSELVLLHCGRESANFVFPVVNVIAGGAERTVFSEESMLTGGGGGVVVDAAAGLVDRLDWDD